MSGGLPSVAKNRRNMTAARLGMSAERVPHMLGASRLPLGVRGLYC